ncbi:hypothetical protein JOE38_001106 [Clavibacter michiganensis]|uniref:Uncharacterized protein n=1 Tax=Clavibacter michiganensis TaxID=28447 RepID=A0A251Y4V0_9MICO|nr:hypothetical protein [Clavibacter michiganensis]MBM7411283.1 hypothetical protein [Clavibacter michiganensis]OUE19302.1 hypothetical protein BFL34_02344 [Clavibacter michiganensis]
MTDPAADAPRHPLAEPAPIDADSVAEQAEAAEEDAREDTPDPFGEGPDDQ